MKAGPEDVVLVRMPYSEIGQPSLALGLLKAVCDKHGVSTRALPANLWFAEEIGTALHDMIFEAYSTTLIGEWTFAGALFPDFHPHDEGYVRKVVSIFRNDSREQWRHIQERYPYLDHVALLREIRRRAPEFVERMADRVLSLEPKIVGCTSTFQQHCASLALLRVIKQRRPDVITMIGGANCEGDMGRTTFELYPWVDFVCSGEADGFFGPLCARLVAGGIDAVAPEHVPAGLWAPHHRRDPERLRQACADQQDGAPIARLDDMNESPVPNYDDYFAYLAESEVMSEWVRAALPFQTARGCWWGEKTHCTFCGISRTAMKFRAKSGDNVIEQMLALRERYAINLFQGTEYIFDYRYFDTLLPRLHEIGGYFRFEVKANLKPQQFQAFVDAGVVEVQPGVESLHDNLLALLKKGTTAYQNLLLLKRARKVGLLAYWNMLHTIPGERDEWYAEMAELIPLVTHLQAPFGVAQIHYDRFSPYWRDPQAHGLELRPAFGYAYVYPFPEDVLKDVAYFFDAPYQRESFQRIDPRAHGGLLKLLKAVFEWRNSWWRSHKAMPSLTATDTGDRIRFEDTRPVALGPSFEIEALERRVYLLAEDGITPNNLLIRLQSEDGAAFDPDRVQAAAQALLDKRVAALVSGRLLALAIKTPVAPYLAHSIDLDRKDMDLRWARLEADKGLDERRPNIALACLRQPGEESLDDWLAPQRTPAPLGAGAK